MTQFCDFTGTPLPVDGNGVPCCPQCGESRYVIFPGRLNTEHPWCDQCSGYLANLVPLPGNAMPSYLDLEQTKEKVKCVKKPKSRPAKKRKSSDNT